MSVHAQNYTTNTGRSSAGAPDFYGPKTPLTLAKGAAGSEASVVITSSGAIVMTVDAATYDRLTATLDSAETQNGSIEIDIETLNKLLEMDKNNPAGDLLAASLATLFSEAVETFESSCPGLYREMLDAYIQANRPLPMSIFDVLSYLLDKSIEALNSGKRTDAMVVAENTKTIVETHLDEQKQHQENIDDMTASRWQGLATGTAGAAATAAISGQSGLMAGKSAATSLEATSAKESLGGIKSGLVQPPKGVSLADLTAKTERQLATKTAEAAMQQNLATAYNSGGQGLATGFNTGVTDAQTQTQISNAEVQAEVAELGAVRESAEALKSTASEGTKSAEETSGQVIQSVMRALDSTAATQGKLLGNA